MKSRIIAGIVAFILPAILLGLGGWMDNQQFIDISRILAPSLFLAGLVYIFWFRIKKLFTKLKSDSLLFFRVMAKWKKSGDLLALINAQQKNPEEWLHPVIKWISFDKKGLPENTIMFSFGIDSGLIDNFNPEKVLVRIELEYGANEYLSKWYQVDNREIKAGCHESWGSISLDVTEDEDMVRGIKIYRADGQLKRTLKVKIQKSDGIKVSLEPIYSIDPQ